MRAGEEVIKDWTGKIIGYVQTDESGNKTLKDFYKRILGKYDKRLNLTKDFYGKIIAKGDQLLMLLNRR